MCTLLALLFTGAAAARVPVRLFLEDIAVQQPAIGPRAPPPPPINRATGERKQIAVPAERDMSRAPERVNVHGKRTQLTLAQCFKRQHV